MVVERERRDGDNEELRRVRDGNSLWGIRGAELRRSRYKEADEHSSRHHRAYRKESSQTQEGRCRLILISVLPISICFLFSFLVLFHKLLTPFDRDFTV